ncbi:MAG: paraquat-inducible protein A [Cyclobacteriaceae bacterium]
MNLRNIIAFVLTIISLILLYPGLTQPILQIAIAPELPLLGKTTFYEQTQSILQTVETLYETKNELVGFLILLFSVIVPVTKGVIILAVLIMKDSKVRSGLHQFVYSIGKWSMADVFVVGIFIAFLSTQSNTAIDAVLLPGFNFFVAYCILSLAGIQLVKIE